MINLLCIVPYRFLPAHTGGQKAVAILYKYIAQRLSFTVAGTKDNEVRGAAYFVEEIFSPSPLRYLNLKNYLRLKRIVQSNNVTHICIEHPYMGLYAIWLKKRFAVKLIVRSHNIESQRFKTLKKKWWRILFYYEKYVHTKADHSFFITPEDRCYALSNFRLRADKTSVLTYGTEINKGLSTIEKQKWSKKLKAQYHIPESTTLLLFNGTFDYQPNYEALKLLLSEILPALLQKDSGFFLLICGKNIPEKILQAMHAHTKIVGFVEDIEAVFKGAEIFINPIWLGGGIKTKLVEALASGCSAVSFESGAIGISQEVVGKKLNIVQDENIAAFASAIIQQRDTINDVIPENFYREFSWRALAHKFVDKLAEI